VEKKHWCCDHHDRGCPHHTTSLPFDCDAGFSNWQQGWSTPKKEWCCHHAHRGCFVPKLQLPVSTEPYNCLDGLNNWQGAWSQGKKLWCCHVKSLGCYSTTAMPYDCRAGLSNWQEGWSGGKKSWCCEHRNLGCHVKVSDPYDCDAGFSNWQAGWSIAKKQWCCGKVNRGCEEHPVQYDCDAGYSNWEKGWAYAKKAWCCTHRQKGCASSTLSPLGCKAVCNFRNEAATCQNRIQFSAEHHFAHKENACGQAYSRVQVECDVCRGCSIEETGCHALEVTISHKISKPFDCEAGFSNWQAGWSEPKKHWCCTHEQKACSAAAETSFDCSAGLSNFHDGWAPAKKTWCCEKQGQGCEGPNPPDFPAGAGFYWKHVQINGFWTWVRAHTSEHLKPQYDCDAGLSNFKMGWAHSKKIWCCEHQQKGCE